MNVYRDTEEKILTFRIHNIIYGKEHIPSLINWFNKILFNNFIYNVLIKGLS